MDKRGRVCVYFRCILILLNSASFPLRFKSIINSRSHFVVLTFRLWVLELDVSRIVFIMSNLKATFSKSTKQPMVSNNIKWSEFETNVPIPLQLKTIYMYLQWIPTLSSPPRPPRLLFQIDYTALFFVLFFLSHPPPLF